MTFPVDMVVGPLKIRAHFLMEALAYTSGFQLFLRLRKGKGDVLSPVHRLFIIAAALCGAAAGSLLLAQWEAGRWSGLGGKTIVGGLVGGMIAVELAKKALKIRTSTGDLFVFPIALGTIIGRVGCFLEGLTDNTYGLPTSLPWGIDFGDGIRRHPTQLYDIVGVAALAGGLVWFQKRPHRSGDLFKAYMIGYLGWRLIIDFLKPGLFFFGLTPIQWTCLATLLYYTKDVPCLIATKEVPANA